MECYEVNNRWVVEVFGGSENNRDIAGEKREYDSRPEPTATWKDAHKENDYGIGISNYTQFKADRNGEEVFFIVEDYGWSPNYGYSWSEDWEVFNDYAEVPTLGDAFKWTGEGWEKVSHPMLAEKART